MKSTLKKILPVLLLMVYTLQIVGCGTIFYPERRGQTGGKIDPGVAILDGLGILFGVVPGLVAYIIDFSTGAIYLPQGTGSSISPEIKVVRIPRGQLTRENIVAVISNETGISPLQIRQAVQTPIEDYEDIPVKLTEAWRAGYWQ